LKEITPFSGDLYASQQARAFLEILQLSKRPGPISKTLATSEIEEKLEHIVRINGEDELNRVWDRAREISLESIIGAILSTRETDILSSPLAVARAFGLPYDPGRLDLFSALFRELFSQFIEGTQFGLKEALQIIESNQPLPARHGDSLDILGTLIKSFDLYLVLAHPFKRAAFMMFVSI